MSAECLVDLRTSALDRAAGIPTLVEPEELIIPKRYTEEVLDRAANARARAGDGGGGDVIIEHIEVHADFHGVDIRDPSERGRVAIAFAREMGQELDRQRALRR